MLSWFRKTKPAPVLPVANTNAVIPPFNVDKLIRSATGHLSFGRLSLDDREFIGRMIENVDRGSKGVFIVVNDDNSMDYLVANDSRVGAIALLGRMIQRQARLVEEGGDD